MLVRSRRSHLKILAIAAAVGLLLVAACGRAPEEAQAPVQPVWPEVEGYAKMNILADNPLTPAKVELGKQLYYDVRLSGDGSRSCYSCHVKENGLTDGRPKAIGAYEAPLPRSSPTLWNIGYHSEFYWDGRSKSLEAQAMAAWTGGNMGVSGKDGRPSTADICHTLNKIGEYRQKFALVFGGGCTPDNVVKAISAFERTIVSTKANAAWIRFRSGDTSALSEEARRGWELFSGKAGCTGCHDGLLLTDMQYHNVGIGWDARKREFADVGRVKVTNEQKDTGAFKTPTLLDISESAPYFHDGSVATLKEAMELMLGGGRKNPYLDTANLQPRQLTAQEKADLLALLVSLTVDYTTPEPKLPE